MVQDQEQSKAIQVGKLKSQVNGFKRAKKALQNELQVNSFVQKPLLCFISVALYPAYPLPCTTANDAWLTRVT